ncbi:glutamyl aminopeptidase-like [Daphnia carinata]|uniref:glutamyl aminopeptidase-like n=1 Tax=Daphnia carinata TaxID=120202 RepID=UPI00257C8A16|nr:glutamyl aminopeptidase-like [Daphnia carinata]
MGFNLPLVTLAVLSGALAIAVIVLSVSLSGANKELSSLKTETTTVETTPIVESTTMAGSTTPQLTEPWELDYRLPSDTLPLHYEIYLHPDLVSGTFTGKVAIHLNVTKPRDFVLIHIKYLTISSTSVHKGIESNGEQISLGETFEYAPNEFWVVKLRSQMQPGLYTVNMDFTGSLTKDIVGFYKSNYYNSDTNQTRTIATSKFEPTYARRAFPCLDEPSYKSTFGVTLVRPKGDGYVSYSNMPEMSVEDDVPSTGLTTVKFQKSVEMVTYLACFIVCDFKERLGHTKRGVPIRTISRSNQFNSTEYPLEIGIKATDYYEEYFDIDYVLPKQDLIAIPDFVSGAMEHWGLVTFRETAMLYDPLESSTSNKKRVATVVAHELAHQWFGNLMTIIWWDDLWLNEGFASYMEFKATDACETTWDMMTFILSDDVGPVLDLDSKLSSHPIVVTVNHPDEITEIFDAISYNKGAAVLMMLESFMGPANFQLGIQNFLKEYKFKNAATADLWRALQAVTPDLDIAGIMDTWTRQMGYPVLSYTINGNKLIVKQSRFLSDPNSNATVTPSPYGYKWDVPVFYITDKDSTLQKKWLYMADDSVTIELPNDVTWVKLNADQRGFFRVNYLPEHWNALAASLGKNVSAMKPSDRWGLIDDSFSLSAAGSLPYSTSLELVQYVKNDRHPVPWSAASGKLSYISSLIYITNLYPGFREFIITLVEPSYLELGWNNQSSFLDQNLQTTILSLACLSDYTPCLETAAERLTKWINNPDEYIPPNFRNLVYRYGIAQIGDAAVWNAMWDRYTKETDPNEAIKLLYGLAFAKEPWLIHQYLDLAKTDKVRSQDYFTVLEYISANPVGLPIVWDFVRNEWQYLVDRFTTNNRYLGRMVGTVTSKFTQQIRLDEMKEFFAKYPDAGAGARAREQSLETVKNNIQWLKVNKPDLENWLKENGFM